VSTKSFKNNAIYGVAGAALIAAASLAGVPALAQDATSTAPADSAVSEVVVTGFRSSLAKALNVKRNEAAAVDSILAEDIGKFPDLNLSESIQRIPGVAITRDGGEGRQISVRGLGPQFTRVRINGMEALTTAGGADASGGTNRGRSFDFNVFASDLFSAITVRKSAEAETEEGSLGATVDLRTARPFDYRGFKMAGSTQVSYNDLVKKASPRGAFMISNTWKDDTFGALISVAYTKRKLVEEGQSTVRWATGSAFAPGFGSVLGATCASTPAACATANAALHPRFPRYDIYTDDQKRLGATGSLQWRPSDTTLLSFDALYADFKATREEQYLEAPSFSAAGACTAATLATTCGIADTDITAMTIDNGVMTRGTFNDVDLRVEDRFDKLDTTFTQFTLEGSHEFSDRFKVNALIGHSDSKHKNPIQTTLTLDQFNVDNYSFDYADPRNPIFNFGTAKLADPTAWVLTQIRERPQFANNKYDAAQAGAEFAVNGLFKVKAGVDFKRYKFATSELRRSNGTTSNLESSIPAAIAAMAVSSYSNVVSFGGQSWISPDLSKAVDALSLYDQSAYNGAFKLGPEPALGNNKGVSEKDSGGFIQGDFNTEIASMPLRGNLGVRYVKTEQTASGYAFVGGVATPVVANRKYSNTLPALNVVLEPTDKFLVRFGAAKVMSRPDLASLTPGATVNVSGSGRSVTVGNPNLDPYLAKTYDLSFEWYFQPGGLLSLALFKKDVNSFVQTISTPGAVFTGNPYGIPDSVAVAACGTVPNCSPSLNNWQFSAPQNTGGGTLKGFEINYQQPFTMLPGLLSHTGLLLNYTGVKSSVNYVNAAGAVVATANLTGLSKTSYNATLYYEDTKFSARVSAAYRSRYLTLVPGREVGTDVDGANATLNVDASLQYTLNDRVKLSLEGVNLTDEHQDQYNDSRNLLSVYHHTGREFIFGVRYTF
jgi:iron complex outermembrane receptor protein